MVDETKVVLAKKVYDTICAAIERREWKYQKDDERLVINFGVNGDDIPMQFIMVVDVERQLVRMMSPMPFKMAEDKRMEGAIVTCVANFGMVDGSFDYDVADGTIVFRMTASFRESVIGDGLFQYMISCSCAMVDAYNDKFLAINKGILSVEDFIAKE